MIKLIRKAIVILAMCCYAICCYIWAGISVSAAGQTTCLHYYIDDFEISYDEINHDDTDNIINDEIIEIERTQQTKETILDQEQDIIVTVKDAYVQNQVIETTESTYDSDKPSMQVFSVDEYLYVNTTNLNVRVGPGTEYEKVTSVSINDEIHRIGVLENGWSLIDYDGNELYVYSKYLNKEKVQTQTTEQLTISEEIAMRDGMIGRLYINSVNLNVALIETDIRNGAQTQKIVDNTDSAAYMPDVTGYYGQVLIGDHVNQGFSAIKKSVPNETIAIIDFGTHSESFICTQIFIGMNTGHDLVDMNKVSVAGKNNGGICMYTCNSDGTITITYWKLL